MSQAAILCFSIGILIAGFAKNDIAIPLPAPPADKADPFYIGPWLNITTLTFPATNIFMNDTSYQLQFNDTTAPGAFGIETKWGKSDKDGVVTWSGAITIAFDLTSVDIGGRLLRGNRSAPCRATDFTLDKCNTALVLNTKKTVCTGYGWNKLDCDFLVPTLEKIMAKLQPTITRGLCDLEEGALGKLLGDILIGNSSLLPEDYKLPAPKKDSPPLMDNAYIRMANTVVAGLPVMDGVTLGLQIVAANAAHFTVSMPNANLSYERSNQTNLAKVEGSIFHYVPGLYDLVLPNGIKLGLDIILDYFVCDILTGACQLRDVELYNVNLRGFNDLDIGLNSLLNFILVKGVDKLLLNATNGTTNITIPLQSKPINGPPRFVYGLLGMLPGFITIALCVASLRYHIKRSKRIEKQNGVITQSLLDDDDNSPRSPPRHNNTDLFIDDQGRTVRTIVKYSVFRGVLRDWILVIMCNSALMMFIYANAETAVTVSLGNEINIFAFSLQNSVRDFWNSGLKALAFFIALFSGAYPYLKLIGIVSIAIVHRNTKSKLLRTIDSVGRFSFLDSFVMMVLVTTLQVPGVADVNARLPFYSFILATALSMIAGNISTHTYDPGLIVEEVVEENQGGALPHHDDDENGYGTQKKPAPENIYDDGVPTGDHITASGGVQKSSTIMYNNAGDVERRSNNADDADIPLLEKPMCSVGVKVALLIFCAAGVWVGICYGWFHYPLRYNFSGFVTVIKGKHQDYSLHRLFFDSPAMLGAVATLTIVFAPLIVATFPHDVVLGYVGPWCSTDVFLLTCIAALLQLHVFIKYQAGPVLGGLIDANAELHYPFYVLGSSVLFQWYYIVKAAVGHDPQPQRSTSGKPADNQAPPWLFFE